MVGKSVAYRNLHLMLQAGLPAVQAFRTAGRSGGSLGRAMARVSGQLADGGPIAEAMACHGVFGLLDTTVVHAGEISGSLPGSFAMLAQWYEFRRQTQQKLKAKMVLPLIVLQGIAVLVPAIQVLSSGQLNFALMGQLAVRNLLLLWVPLLVIWWIINYAPQQGLLRRGLDHVLLAIPVLGGAMRQLALARYFWAYHALAKAGVDAVRTSQMAAQVAGNSVISAQLEGATQAARRGDPVSEGLRRALPREYMEIWDVGEQTGEVEESARRLADIATERSSSRLTALAVTVPMVLYLGALLYGAYVVVSWYAGYINGALRDASSF